ncbi:MAG: hypothetical protein GOVbin3171_56 [Prokaryotic dsDNA virus sp.]|nr:MAG: hypothetical protein GOVbin3171_56 [Prokaryotic dsDNA virus sp.]|tara:strand:- start:7911 stop:9071 length:1161 start_codon:yes stop_codon:yes gene_type:complete
MKKILWLVLLFSTTLNAQILDKIFKYSTVYAAGDISNSIEEAEPLYFVRTNPNGGLYSVPVVEDNTPEYPYDYRIGFGIRKLARFDYERKPKNFYDGTESQLAFTAPTSAVTGLEYQFHFEEERFRGIKYKNHRYFVKHTGKYHIIKAESREVGRINLNYMSAEARLRVPIGEKFSVSMGAIYRTHDRPYGYNPIEIWLNELDEDGFPVNYWYELGFEYGYDDIFYTSEDEFGNETSDWYWIDPDGNRVADSDLEFRETVFRNLMNRYNREMWSQLDSFGEIAPIVGFDFYHYKNNFWLHAYGNYILPHHKYLKGDETVSYLNRNNWGLGGLIDGAKLEQWEDYSAGISFGWRLGRSIGVFAEGEYSKMWDSQLFQTTFGINYMFK